MSEPHTADEQTRIVAALSSLHPDPAATDRARAAVIGAAAAPSVRRPLRWVRPSLRFALPAAGIAAIGTVLVLSLPRGEEDRAAVPPGPQTESCVVQRGQTFRILPLEPAVAMRAGTATVMWNAFDRSIRVADAPEGGPFASTRLSGPDVFGTIGPAFEQNERGDGVAAWVDARQVVAVHRSAGGEWSEPEVLGRVNADRGPYNGPAVAMAPDGTATVAWPSGTGLRGARRAPDGAWSRSATRDPAPLYPNMPGASEVAMATDDDGDVAAVWMLAGDGIGAATWPVDETGWTPTQKVLSTVSGPISMYGNARIVGSGRGFVLSMLVGRTTRVRDGGLIAARDDMVVATRLPAGASTWSRAVRMSPRGEVPGQNTSVAGPDGEVAVAWTATAAPGTPAYQRPGFPPRTLRVALSQDGRFRSTLLVPGARGTISSPALALGDGGQLTVAWTDGANRNSGRNSSVRVITYTAGQGWSGARRISDRGTGPLTPALARDAAGNTVAAWMRCAGGRDLVLQVATRPAGADWGAATRVQ